jgi:hypothetical protein
MILLVLDHKNQFKIGHHHPDRRVDRQVPLAINESRYDCACVPFLKPTALPVDAYQVYNPGGQFYLAWFGCQPDYRRIYQKSHRDSIVY